MFITIKKLKQAITEIIDQADLTLAEKKQKDEKILELTRQIAELEFKKEMEEREIKHLVKMKEEKISIETKQKELDLQANFNKKEMELQKTYHEKVLKTIDESRQESKELYLKIMERLPNVNVEVSRNK